MDFERALSGGRRNSLGRTDEAIAAVLADRTFLRDLFDCLGSEHEFVRTRAADALEKVCREHPSWFGRDVDRLLDEVSEIDQPSVQSHLAQILGHIQMEPAQYRRSRKILMRNLDRRKDWFVLNVTMNQLAAWSRSDPGLRRWLRPRLDRLAADPRRSVSHTAKRLREPMEAPSRA